MSEASNSLPQADFPIGSPIKRRHPLERALVWGLIAVLFTMACVETWSRYSFQRAFDFLGNRLEVGDEHTAEALDAGDVKAFLNDRQPSRTEDFARSGIMMSNGATHLEVYSWFTWNPVHRREMFVYYDTYGPARKDHPQVLSIQAVEAEFIPWLSAEESKAIDQTAKLLTERGIDMSQGMSGMSGMPEMGSRGRGRRRFPDTDKTATPVLQPAVDADKGDNRDPQTRAL